MGHSFTYRTDLKKEIYKIFKTLTFFSVAFFIDLIDKCIGRFVKKKFEKYTNLNF